jgi:hypothetical protein
MPEEELDHLDGHKGSKPVRIGNGASDHVQLDIYGELMCVSLPPPLAFLKQELMLLSFIAGMPSTSLRNRQSRSRGKCGSL